METVAVIVALIVAVFVALAVVATVKAVKAVKRGVDRTVVQARRTVEDTRLKAKQYVPGPGAEVAQLRLALRTSMRATQDALRERAPEDPSLSESQALFQRLSAHGRELDEDLRRLEAEPSQSRVAESLPELRERTEHIRQAADSLRWAAQDRARQFTGDDLADLSEQIRMEASALRHWTSVADDGAAPSTASAPPTASERSAAGKSSEPAPPEREKPAIAGQDSRRASTGYPWEKWQRNGRRPESTT